MTKRSNKKAFGKFTPNSAWQLREFEVKFQIEAREGPSAWKSRISAIQNLLDHLRRYTESECSREKYLRHLLQFCRRYGFNPEYAVRIPKKKVESLVQGFADELASKDRSKAYVNTVVKRLRTFFRVNGYTGSKELRIRTYFVPTRYRKMPEYIPTKEEIYSMADAAGGQRNRAIILTLFSSGLRVSTLCGLNRGDIAHELEASEPYLMIPVYPEMKERVPDACKGRIPYYTFICPEAGEALRSYLRHREERYGPIGIKDPLFHSDWTLWPRRERSSKRLGRRGVGLIVKRASRLAGIQPWKYVTPHCLRKTFESVLRSPTVDRGRMDKGTQEFFMGHILPGTQDVYYDKTKVEFHRDEYAKLDFSIGRVRVKVVDRLIDLAELEKHLSDSWMFVAKISDHKVVVRRSSE